jgi:hypothetical protein
MREKRIQSFGRKIVKERDRQEDLDVDERILRRLLNKVKRSVWIGFSWIMTLL